MRLPPIVTPPRALPDASGIHAQPRPQLLATQRVSPRRRLLPAAVSIQPRATMRLSRPTPTGPARWWRRSVQSRHWRGRAAF